MLLFLKTTMRRYSAIILTVFILLLTQTSFGQGFNKMDTLDQVPQDVKRVISGTITQSFLVDFPGDGIQDFICKLDLKDKTRDVLWTFDPAKT